MRFTYVAGIGTIVTLPRAIGTSASHQGIETRGDAKPVAETNVAVTATVGVFGAWAARDKAFRVTAVRIVAPGLVLVILRGDRKR